jgi:catechol 2,3-dioxygenase-like lactoylglutathione lyase family enzyme
VPWQLDHVQLAIPPGAEGRCDEFYVTLLGFHALEKPPVLAARGGRWYRNGAVTLHLGVEDDFRPAKKAHPALSLDDYEPLLARLSRAGIDVRDDQSIPGTTRCYVEDPVGNRLELIDASTLHS